MDNLLFGFKKLTLGVVAALTAVSGAGGTPQAAPSPLPSPAKNIIVRSGEYSHSGYTLKYTIRVPKKGGPITGNFSGVCEGPITGKFDGVEGGKAEGEAKASCGVAFIRYNLKATYSANLYLKEGKADINWEGEIPYTSNKGFFTTYFEPVN